MYGDGLVVELSLEAADAVAEFVFIVVAMQYCKLLAHLLPQPLDRHQVRAVGRQVQQLDF